MRKRLFFLLTGFLFWGISTASPATIAPHKLETAQRVFDRLILARGDFGLPRPGLELVAHSSELARFSGQTVFLGEKAYDICISFGADSLNALAILLGHELIHYYAGHTWEQEFSREFASTKLQEEVKDSWLQDEVQADLWGGLLSFSAGYNVQKVMPEFLPKLYEAFNLGEEISGYPHLSERVQLARKSAEKLEILLGYFETANYLVGIGMYEDALGYYQTILNEGYRGRELYNNIGVFHVQAALQLFRKTEMPYGLPLELDANSRMATGTRGGAPAGNREQRMQHLQDALHFFETARSMDPAYTVALINMGCVQALMALSTEDPDEADLAFTQGLIYAKKSEREAVGNVKANADIMVLRGLLAVLQDDAPGARRFWELAASPLALANLQVLEKGAFGVTGERLARTSEREQIEGLSLDLFLRKPLCDTLTGLETPNGKIQWGKGAEKPGLQESSIYLHLVSANRFAVMQITNPDYTGETLLGIRPGDSREKVLSAYKTPDGVVQLSNGEFLYYPAREILFRIDDRQQVAGWCVFRVAP